MKKIVPYLLTAVLSLSLVSCFEIKEEITLKKNGSGSYAMTFDLGEMMSMVAMMSDDEEGQDSLFQEMDGNMKDLQGKLADIEGISEVKAYREDSKIHLTYRFASIEALNKATQQGNPVMDDLQPVPNAGPQFAMEGKKIFRRAGLPEGATEAMTDMDEDQMEMAKMFMEDASYTTVYHFPRKVKKMSNEEAELSEDKKTVTLKAGFLDLVEGKIDLGNEIRMK